MSYQNVLDSIYAQATAVTGFSSSNVGPNDFDVLRTGQGSACVISYDSFQQSIAEFGDHNIKWRFLIGLYVRATGRDASAVSQDMNTIREGFIDRFNAYPRLGGTANIWDSLIEDGAEADEPLVIGGVSFMYEVMRLAATEEVTVSYQG